MNRIFNSLILFAMCLLLLLRCGTQKEAIDAKPFELKHWLTLDKFPCFGHCQVYKISAYRNGLVILEGKEHLEKKGVYFCELNDEKIARLKRMTESTKWSNYKNEYIVHIADLPVTELQYFDNYGAKVKHIKANSNLPDALHNTVKFLSELINTQNWTQIQKKNDMINPEIITNEFLIDLDSSLTKESLEAEFALYELKAIQQMSAYMNLWNFRYNEEKIGKYEMLIMLRKKNGIRSVNFNRKILPRE